MQDKQFIQGFIADSYIDIQAARLMTLHTAEKIDRGLQAARTDISAIKVFVPSAYMPRRRPSDSGLGSCRRLQRPSAVGDVPRSVHAAHRRRADEVHKILIAKNVLGQYAKGEGWDFGN